MNKLIVRILLILSFSILLSLSAFKSSALPSSELRREIMRKAAAFLRRQLREEDVIARVKETIFAFLLPDMRVDEAQSVMDKLQADMISRSFEAEREGVSLSLSSLVHVVAYQDNHLNPEEFFVEAEHAMQPVEVGQ